MENLTIRESDNSVFGIYGIEDNSFVPNHPDTYKIANHIRALLDLVSEGNFGYAQGMNKDFICNNKVFSKLLLLRTSHMWEKIQGFIGKEYGVAWLRFLQNHENEP